MRPSAGGGASAAVAWAVDALEALATTLAVTVGGEGAAEAWGGAAVAVAVVGSPPLPPVAAWSTAKSANGAATDATAYALMRDGDQPRAGATGDADLPLACARALIGDRE